MLPELAKKYFRKPLGRILKMREAMLLLKGKKLVTVGDISTLKFLKNNIIPFLAVYDKRYLRKKMKRRDISYIRKFYKHQMRIKNPPGTISNGFLEKTKTMLRKGGLVFVDGEEDLTILPLVVNATMEYLFAYGQWNMGLIVVTPTKKTKTKARRLLSILLSFQQSKAQETQTLL